MAYARTRDPAGTQDSIPDGGGRGQSAHREQAWPHASTRSPGYVQAPSAEHQVGAGVISREVSGATRDTPAFPAQERKSWLKPVSSLLQGIPDSKRGPIQRDFRGVDHCYPPLSFTPAVHPLMIQREREGESRFSQQEAFRGIRGDQHLGVDIVHRREAAATATPQNIERLKYEQFARAVEPEALGRGLHPRGAHDRSFSPRFVSARDGYNLQSSPSDYRPTTNEHFRHHARSEPECNDPSKERIVSIEHGVSRGLRPDSSGRDGDRVVIVQPTVAPARDSLVDRSRANDNFNCVGETSRSASHVAVARREPDIWHKAPIETAPITAAATATSRPASFLTLRCDSSAGSPAKRSKEQQEVEGIVRRPPVSQTVKLGEKSPQAAVDSRRRNRCLGPGCNKSPRYALPGQKAEYCSQHKMENYVDVKHPRCESELGCVRQPTFGWEGEKARFCSAHKVEGMLDVKNPRCAEPGCMKRPRYGAEGERARFCAAHKFDNMVDLATRRGAKCHSPAKRSRDGPRSFAHDFAAVSVPGTGPRRTSMPSFNLGTSGSAPTPKRGHTPAHAGGHRRATSESWIDFCPKRVFDTTAKYGVEGHVVADGIESEIRARVPTNVNTCSAEVNPDRRALYGSTSARSSVGDGGGGMGSSYDRRFTPAHATKNIPVGGDELVSAAPTQRTPRTASPPCRPVPSMLRASSSSASGVKPSPPPLPSSSPSQKTQQKTQRFDAVDYEASAILLECRSGALLPRHLRSRSP